MEIPSRQMIKTDADIEGIRRAGHITKEILDIVEERIRPGVTTEDVNRWVHEATLIRGGIPACLNFKGFPKSCCVSINECICHGIPGPRILLAGDIVNVDVTTIYEGYFGDASRMYIMGETTAEGAALVRVARECLELGMEEVKPFNRIGDIAYAIEQHALKHGFSVVREFGGHGIGKEFHEDPFIFHYGQKQRGLVLVPNMVFTIEPMINAGDFRLRILADHWTTITKDGSWSAQWEHTLRVTETGYDILTL
jgi:methionyl aminopeptidase